MNADTLTAARRNASFSMWMSLLFFIPVCWVVGLVFAIVALSRSRGQVGVDALLVNLGALVVAIILGAMVARW